MQPPLVFPGVVHGLGSDGYFASSLYASLTGRSVNFCNDVGALKTEAHDVVVCSTSQLTAPLMYKLYVNSDNRGAPGLICARTSAELEDICRKQANRLLRPRTKTIRRAFIYSMLDFEMLRRGEDLIVGGAQSADSLQHILSSELSVLTLFTHSDGTDARLSLRQFACPFIDVPAKGDEEFKPACQVLKQCVRFPSRPSIEHARDAGWIVPLSVFRAEIGIVSGSRIGRGTSENMLHPTWFNEDANR